MGRFQGVVWAVVVLGLVGCQAPIDPSKKVPQEDLLALAPDLISTADDEATVGFVAQFVAANKTLKPGSLSDARKMKPGDPMPPQLKSEAAEFLDQIESALTPEWKHIHNAPPGEPRRSAYFLRAISYGARSREESVRANRLTLLLAQRATSLASSRYSFFHLALSGQGVLNTLAPGDSFEEELKGYLQVLPKQGEYAALHEQAMKSEWTFAHSRLISERPYPIGLDRDIFGSNPEPFDRRATALLFIKALRSDIAAFRIGQPSANPRRDLPRTELTGLDGDASAEDIAVLREWSQQFPRNAVGEYLLRDEFTPMSALALRETALAAVLRGSFATMIMMNRGQRPESWEDVVEAGLLEEVPLDPYSKKPLEADFVKGRIRCQSVQISGKKLTNPLNEAVVQIPDWLLKRAGG